MDTQPTLFPEVFMDERFLRNEMLWGSAAQQKLARSHVIIFGLGGVGSYTAECLARAGIGELTLVDSDTVSVSNRNRQQRTIRNIKVHFPTLSMDSTLPTLQKANLALKFKRIPCSLKAHFP